MSGFTMELARQVRSTLASEGRTTERKQQNWLQVAGVPFAQAFVWVSFVLCLLALPAILAMPSLAFCFRYLSAEAGAAQLSLAQMQFGMLATQSATLVCAAVMAMCPDPARLFYLHPRLKVQAFFPITDRQLLNQALRRWALFSPVLMYALFFVYGPLTWYSELSFWQIIGMIGGALLQTWMLLAFVVTVASCVSRSRVYAFCVGTIVFVAGLHTIGIIGVLKDVPLLQSLPLESVQLWMFFPPGWVNSLIYFGILQGNVQALWLLVPIGLISGYAMVWLWRGFAISDVGFNSRGEARPNFHYGFQPAPAVKKRVAAKLNSSRAAERLLDSSTLRPCQWNGGFIERFVGQRLSHRERVLVQQFYGAQPAWTWGWCFLLVVMSGIAMACFMDPAPIRSPSSWAAMIFETPFPILLVLLGPLAAAYGMGFARGFLRAVNNSTYGVITAVHPIYPVGHQETIAAVRKASLWRLPFVLLIVVPAAWMVASHKAYPALSAIGAVVAVLCLSNAWQGFATRLRLSTFMEMPARQSLTIMALLALAGLVQFLLITLASPFVLIPSLAVVMLLHVINRRIDRQAASSCCRLELAVTSHPFDLVP